ncbi:MAG: hypothetical protein LLF94_04095 [Chlamydiales bacterium]|nr:hypothetical protein [Chlamydiales bacterium]
MSITNRFADWGIGKDQTIDLSIKKVKLPLTSIVVTLDGKKVTGESFLAELIKGIKADPKLSDKLKQLKDNESVKIFLAGRSEYVLSKKSSNVIDRTISASFVITNNNAPAINRDTKPVKKAPPPPAPKPLTKQQKAQQETQNRDMWDKLHRDGEVTVE